jgi:CRISPR-associated protein Cas2
MYVILVYDIEQKRVGKACKLVRKYLNWVQNSVFEGELSEAKLKEVKLKMKHLMDMEKDSVLIYKLRTAAAATRETLGIEKNPTDAFI